MRAGLLAVIMSACVLTGINGCSTAPQSDEGKEKLTTNAQNSLSRFEQTDPSLQSFLDKAHGYAIFPKIGKGAVGVGGAYGKGEVYEQGVMIGYCDMTQGTIGLQLGGQSYSELIVFQDKAALDRFTNGQFAFDAQASAVALHSGASADAKFNRGVAVFTATNAGLMFEASVGGQKFSFQRK